MSPGFRNRQRYIACAMLCALLVSSAPGAAQAQVWDCSGQYTNQPEGKGACRPAGGVKSCGSDGNRYFSPRKADERPLGSVCSSTGRSSVSPFVDMRQAALARFGGSGVQERMVAPSRAPATSKESAPKARPETLELGSVEDIFSCYSKLDKVNFCNPRELGRFVQQTFMEASRAMR